MVSRATTLLMSLPRAVRFSMCLVLTALPVGAPCQPPLAQAAAPQANSSLEPTTKPTTSIIYPLLVVLGGKVVANKDNADCNQRASVILYNKKTTGRKIAKRGQHTATRRETLDRDFGGAFCHQWQPRDLSPTPTDFFFLHSIALLLCFSALAVLA